MAQFTEVNARGVDPLWTLLAQTDEVTVGVQCRDGLELTRFKLTVLRKEPREPASRLRRDRGRPPMAPDPPAPIPGPQGPPTHAQPRGARPRSSSSGTPPAVNSPFPPRVPAPQRRSPEDDP